MRLNNIVFLLISTKSFSYTFSESVSRTLGRLYELEQRMHREAEDAFTPAAVRNLERLRRDRRPEEAATAASLLAEYYLLQDREGRALAAVEDYAGYSENNLTIHRLRCFLIHARALAASGRVREAVHRLDYAVDNTEGEAASRAHAAQGDLAMDTGNYADAAEHYREALDYGTRFFRPRRESIEEERRPVPGVEGWRRLRPGLESRLEEAERRRDIKRYGEGFYHWREARRLHLDEQYEKAGRAYARLISRFPDTVYAEGARFHNAEALMQAGETRSALRALQDFFRDDRRGLWRGEALYTIGEIHLRHNYDTRLARRFFEQTLEWIEDTRRRQRDVRLYMVPDKAGKITRPAARPMRTVDFELHDAKTEPRMVINRETADWYLDRLAWNTLYYLGLLAAVDDDWEQAKTYWTRAYDLNPQLQRQHNSQLGSLHRRLMNAVRGEALIIRPYELEEFRGRRHRERRVRIMLADFDAARLNWDSAKKLYRKIIDDRSATEPQRAAAMHGLGSLFYFSGRGEQAEEIFWEIVDRYPDAPAAFEPLYHLMNRNDDNPEKVVRLSRHAERIATTQNDRALAVFQKAKILEHCHGKSEKARAIWRRLLRDYPDSNAINLTKAWIERSKKLEEKDKQ